jgi:hypothetical protein
MTVSRTSPTSAGLGLFALRRVIEHLEIEGRGPGAEGRHALAAHHGERGSHAAHVADAQAQGLGHLAGGDRGVGRGHQGGAELEALQFALLAPALGAGGVGVLPGLGAAQGSVVFALVHEEAGVAEVGGEVAGPQGGHEEGEARGAVAFLEEIVHRWLAVEADGSILRPVGAGDHVAHGAGLVVVRIGGDGLGREGDREALWACGDGVRWVRHRMT